MISDEYLGGYSILDISRWQSIYDTKRSNVSFGKKALNEEADTESSDELRYNPGTKAIPSAS